MDRNAFKETVASLGLNLSDEQIEDFAAFEDCLYEANQVMNLTRVPREECWLRHFVDSLLFQDLIPEGCSVLDVGTGPGFPAWPLACARPDLRVTAIDSSGKMIGFLASFSLPNLEAVQVRAEEWGRREEFDVVTGRALAPLPIQLELSAPACRVGGAVIPMRTPNDANQFESSGAGKLGLRFDHVERRTLPGTDIERVFPVYLKLRDTSTRYPRSWAEIRKRPLSMP